jgi:hypothetical protein
MFRNRTKFAHHLVPSPVLAWLMVVERTARKAKKQICRVITEKAGR